jgi:hypothetical protein
VELVAEDEAKVPKEVEGLVFKLLLHSHDETTRITESIIKGERDRAERTVEALQAQLFKHETAAYFGIHHHTYLWIKEIEDRLNRLEFGGHDGTD